MDKETFLQKITEIGTCEDMVSIRTMLAELSDEVSKVYDNVGTHESTIETLNATITKNNEDMEKLRQANMDLFLRIGTPRTEQQMTQSSTGQKETEKRKFEDLFKEEEGGDK